MDKELVPELRFDGFEEPWEEKKLGEAARIFDGVHQTPDYQKSGIMFLSVEDITTLKSSKYISKEAFYRDFSKAKPSKGDVLMTRIGDIGTPNVVETDEQIAYYVSLALLKPVQVNSYYLNYCIQSEYVQKSLQELSLSTAIPIKINKDDISKAKLAITQDIAEQKRLGCTLRILDSLIAEQEKKCAALGAARDALLDKMFPKEGETEPELRFDGFSGPWEQVKLGDITEFHTGSSFNQNLSDSGKYIVMDMGSVNVTGARVEKKRTNLSRDVLQIGDLIMPKDDIGGGYIIGRTAYVPRNNNYVLGDHVYRLRISNHNALFVHYQINSSIIRAKILSKVTGSAQLGLNYKNIQAIPIAAPSIAEQQAIAQGLFLLELQIKSETDKLDQLKQVKGAMLDKMFPKGAR